MKDIMSTKLQDSLERRFAIVTGGTRGIGSAITRMLLGEGYDVLVTYASDDEAAKNFLDDVYRTFPERSVEVFRADQSDYSDISRVVNRISDRPIDCIVFNAGITLRKRFQEISNDDWNRVMNANVNSSVFMLRDLSPQIAGDARIIFIGSMMAVRPHATSLAYGVAKSAVHALALNLVKVFEGTGTTINVIAPGFVETDWQKKKPKEIRENICKKTAAKRFASPEEIADAARFCLKNPFVNGSVIEVSGGYDYK